MRVRKVDAAGDMRFGGGQRDFWRDQREGVGQIVASRLALELGEWFLDETEGTAWRTDVLGKYTETTRDMEIRTRILGTIGVVEIKEYGSGLDPITRRFSVAASVETTFGVISV